MENYRFKSNRFFHVSMNSILSKYRRGIIKFHFRLERTARKFNLTVDQVYTIWFECWTGMSTLQFFRLFNCDTSFRETMIRRYIYGEDV